MDKILDQTKTMENLASGIVRQLYQDDCHDFYQENVLGFRKFWF